MVKLNRNTAASSSYEHSQIPLAKTPNVSKLSRFNPTSLLDAVGNDPNRLGAITNTLSAFYRRIISINNAVYNSFFKLGGSFADIFCVTALLDTLKHASIGSSFKVISPYFLAGLTEYLSHELWVENNFEQKRDADVIKFAVSCVILGHSMTHRITEQPRNKNLIAKIMQQTAAIWSFVCLHSMSYSVGSGFADKYLSGPAADNLITEETRESLALLSGIIATSAVLPKILLLMVDTINKHMLKKESGSGNGSQSSRKALIPNGITSDVNTILLTYTHFTSQLSDPSRLFQYLIVILNVLKDVDIHDPTKPIPQKPVGWSRFIKKTRNLWLLVADSIVKARLDLTTKLGEIADDTAINAQEYTVIRNGIQIKRVYRYELQVGDLVPLEEATTTVLDNKDGTTRRKATLAGYLIQKQSVEDPATRKKVAISLVELNGESKPVILAPLSAIKQASECKTLDLLTVVASSAIFPGTEFLSYDNGNPNATAEGLYLQIAAASESKQRTLEKIPFSARQIADLKTTLIKGVLGVSVIAALILMEKPQANLEFKKILQFYGTESINRFTQVFVETQTLIPLTSDIVLEVTNNQLLKEINTQLQDKITLKNALLIADIFQFLHEKSVEIYSDKTGTVTVPGMFMRNIIPSDQIDSEKILLAFATTFSDQKTEAEENEIRRYYMSEGVKIESKLVSGQSKHLEKTILQTGKAPLTCISKHLGLFTDFGGQFTLREQENKPPVLVFCGIPRALDNNKNAKFNDTNLLRDYQDYEKCHLADQTLRQDSLTRDWCIAECKLSSETHAALLKAMEEDNSAQIKKIIDKLTGHFEYLGTFQIDNPIKPGAREAIQQWDSAGIGFMLITGDTKNAARMIAAKLYPDRKENIFESETLPPKTDWEKINLKQSTVVLTDTNPDTLALLNQLNALPQKPNIIFCQMKDSDKEKLVEHGKQQGKFIIANGDGCNDLLMLQAAHIAIGDAAQDGSFARGVQEASTFTDVQLRQLMQGPTNSLYELLDLQKGSKSLFLEHFARMSNTQPKIITSLLGKAFKSVAIPRALGLPTNEISGQFGAMLAYDAGFIGAATQASLATANTPLLAEPVNKSNIPFVVLMASVVMAAAQAFYCYTQRDQQVTTGFIMCCNLAFSIGCLYLFLAPPGYSQKMRVASVNLA